METPPLQSQVTRAGAGIVTLLLLAVAVFLYASMRAELESSLDEVLDARAVIAVSLAEEVGASSQLVDALAALGIPAVVTSPDGTTETANPVVPRFGQGGIPTTVPEPRVSRTVSFPDGGAVTVFATRAGVDATLQRLRLLEAIAILTAVILAVFLIGRATRTALHPLRLIAATAERTAAGRIGERLRPDQPDTELGRLAVAFDDMLDALQAALDDAVTSEARTRRFLADAAHQLRTPIAGVRASVEMLLREDDPAERDQLMGMIVRETARMGRLVSALLRIAYLDQGRPPARRPTDVVALVEDEVERARDLAPHIAVHLDLGVPRPGEPLLDGPEIREALGNILDNARRHARERIDVRVDCSAAGIRIHVADDGPGVDPEARELIFERFATLDGAGGSGLGLPIARGVVRAHDGDVTYADGGFTLSLPPAAGTSDPATEDAR